MVLSKFMRWLGSRKSPRRLPRGLHRGEAAIRLGIERLEDRDMLAAPDLLVLDPIAPAAAILGQSIAIQFTVVNNIAVGAGNQAADLPWYEAVVLSRDASYDNSDIFVANPYAGSSVFSLAPGERYSVSLNPVLPANFDAGNAYLLFITDSYKQVNEDDETNNLVARPITLTAPNVDLVVTALSAPATARLGDTATLSWTVANQGGDGTTGYWDDYIYLSADETYDPRVDTYLGARSSTPLGAAESYNRTHDVTIRSNVSPGAQFLLLVTGEEGTQAENSRHNNVRAAPITIVSPDVDLTVSSTTAPATMSPGVSTSLSWTITNQGTETTSQSWYDAVLYSPTATLDPSTATFVTLIHNGDHVPLGPGASYNKTQGVVLPGGVNAGPGYLLFVADYYRQQPETNEANNVQAVPIVVTMADLVVSASAPVSVKGVEIPVSMTVTNQGAGAAVTIWSDAVYLSADQTLDASDILAGSFNWPTSLAAGAAYTITPTVMLPNSTAPGAYYLLFAANANAQQSESDVTNNIHAVAIILLPSSDLAVTASASPASVSVGSSYSVSFTVSNIGSASTTSGWADAIYLSDTPTIGAGSTLLFSQPHPSTSPLAVGASETLTRDFKMPLNAPTGNRYLIFATDQNNPQSEGAQANNLKAVPLTVSPLPDLVVSALTAPPTVNIGAPASVTYTVTNQGGASALGGGVWNETLYLSTDSTLDSGDVFVATYNPLSLLAAGGIYNGSQTVTIPTVVPGSYHLLLVTDSGNRVLEIDEANNTRAMPITVAPALIDLTVIAATSPATATLGASVPLSFTVKNQGTQSATAFWTDAVYVSTSPTLDATAVRLQTFTNTLRPMAAGGTYIDSSSFVTLSTGIPTGSVYLLFVADIDNQQLEGDDSNNVFAAPITISAPNLVLTAATGPATAELNGTISISFTVANQGNVAMTNGWSDYLFISDTPTVDSSATSIRSWFESAQTPLAPGAAFTITENVNIGRVRTGNRYLVFVANRDNFPAESIRTDNVRAMPITITGPDLVVTTATAPSSASLAGQIAVSWTVANQGTAATPANWPDAVYISDTPTFDFSATFLIQGRWPAYGRGRRDGTRDRLPRLFAPCNGIATASHSNVMQSDAGSCQLARCSAPNGFAR